MIRAIRNNDGRPLYYLDLKALELFDKTVVQSSLPEELIWHVGRDVLSPLSSSISFEEKEAVRSELICRLNLCPITKYFHFPEVVMSEHNLKQFTLERYNVLLDSTWQPGDHLYSDYYSPLFFEVIKRQFNVAQYFGYREFERNLVQISRREFQLAITSQRSASQYVRFYNKEKNIFYSYERSGYSVFLMTSGYDLKLVLILEKNEGN